MWNNPWGKQVVRGKLIHEFHLNMEVSLSFEIMVSLCAPIRMVCFQLWSAIPNMNHLPARRPANNNTRRRTKPNRRPGTVYYNQRVPYWYADTQTTLSYPYFYQSHVNYQPARPVFNYQPARPVSFSGYFYPGQSYYYVQPNTRRTNYF